MSSNSLELLAALFTSVIFTFYPFWWYFKVHRATDSTHILSTSIGGIGQERYKLIQSALCLRTIPPISG